MSTSLLGRLFQQQLKCNQNVQRMPMQNLIDKFVNVPEGTMNHNIGSA